MIRLTHQQPFSSTKSHLFTNISPRTASVRLVAIVSPALLHNLQLIRIDLSSLVLSMSPSSANSIKISHRITTPHDLFSKLLIPRHEWRQIVVSDWFIWSKLFNLDYILPVNALLLLFHKLMSPPKEFPEIGSKRPNVNNVAKFKST